MLCLLLHLSKNRDGARFGSSLQRQEQKKAEEMPVLAKDDKMDLKGAKEESTRKDTENKTSEEAESKVETKETLGKTKAISEEADQQEDKVDNLMKKTEAMCKATAVNEAELKVGMGEGSGKTNTKISKADQDRVDNLKETGARYQASAVEELKRRSDICLREAEKQAKEMKKMVMEAEKQAKEEVKEMVGVGERRILDSELIPDNI